MEPDEPGPLELFLELVRIDATSGREEPVADYLCRRLAPLGLAIARDDLGNLIATCRGGGDRALISHMDTARSTAGIATVVEDGVVRSDGRTILGADNRAGIAAIVGAVESLAAAGVIPPCTLVFTVREESDLAGARSVALPAGVKVAFVFDSSRRPGTLIVRAPGARRFRAEVRGRASHAGLAPEAGVNAILVAARAISGIAWGRVDELTTANVGLIEGGDALNVVPDRAVVRGEVRSLERERVDRLVGVVRERFEEAAAEADADLEFEMPWEFEPYEIPEGNPARRRAAAAIERIGLVPEPVASSGGSDANVLNARGIPTVNLGIGAENPHSGDEFIRIEDLTAASAIAVALLAS